jgi:hypothetical protein
MELGCMISTFLEAGLWLADIELAAGIAGAAVGAVLLWKAYRCLEARFLAQAINSAAYKKYSRTRRASGGVADAR